MASAVGSGVLALLALLVVCAVALVLLRYFLPLRSTPSYLSVPIFFSLVLPLSIILLLPIDLASSAPAEDEAARGIWLHSDIVLVAWRIAYWLMFFLTWLILPILGEYADSGYRKPLDRFIYSLKSNGRFWLTVIACSALGAIYILLQNGFNGESFKALFMALAYFVGLLQAIYMMGHGLVVIPRRLIYNANLAQRLKRIQSQAVRVHEKMEDALQETALLDGQLQQLRRKTDLSAEHKDWVEDLVDVASLNRSRKQSSTLLPRDAAAAPPNFITDRYLADLTRRLQRSRHKRDRFVTTWYRLIQDSVTAQAILDSKASGNLVFTGSSRPQGLMSYLPTVLTPSTRCLLHTRVLPIFRLTAAVILSLASCCIIWSELVKFTAPWLSVISLTVIHRTGDETAEMGFEGQLIASLWLLYMCACVLATFGDVKVWGNRALVRRNTYGESACWYAAQVAKLTVPLAYNFLSFIPPGIHRKTVFYNFLGQWIDLTPFGDWFDNLFPVLILIPVFAALFNLYGRVQRWFGIGLIEEEDEEGSTGFATSGWREGRALIDAELQGGTDIDSTNLLGGSSTSQGNTATGDQLGGRGSSRREAPSLYIPPEESNDIQSSSRVAPYSSTSSASRAATSPATRAALVADEDDENIFSGFAHRVKNTVDSIERPEWINELGKRPKWLGRPNGNGESSGRADFGRGLGRWFGGRPSDGQVRL